MTGLIRLEKYLSVVSVPLLCKCIMTSDSMNTIIAHYHDDCSTAAASSEAALNVPRGWLIAVELCWKCYLFV